MICRPQANGFSASSSSSFMIPYGGYTYSTHGKRGRSERVSTTIICYIQFHILAASTGAYVPFSFPLYAIVVGQRIEMNEIKTEEIFLSKV